MKEHTRKYQARKLLLRCDCGNPAFKLVGIDPVCARCAKLESEQGRDRARQNLERPLADGRPSISPFDPGRPSLFQVYAEGQP